VLIPGGKSDASQGQVHFIALNLEPARGWKSINDTKAALPAADEWAKI